MSCHENGLKLVDSVKTVSRETRERLTVYHDLLVKWQSSINLIAPSTIHEIWSRHIADSVQCAVLVPQAKHIIDIGSGAGFPGMVMGILMAERVEAGDAGFRLEFIESSGKKCAFLNAVVREVGLRKVGINVDVHHGRIETVLPNLSQPDVISARALASLEELLALTDPFLRESCIGIFPKGRGHDGEIQDAQKKWQFDRNITSSRFEEGSVILQVSNVHPK